MIEMDREKGSKLDSERQAVREPNMERVCVFVCVCICVCERERSVCKVGTCISIICLKRPPEANTKVCKPLLYLHALHAPTKYTHNKITPPHPL